MATNEQIKTFINSIAPLIQREAKKRGYQICSTVIAQAGVESAWGLSGLAKYHNYFGMKCGSKWTGRSVNKATKEEYTPGVLTTIRDNFRAYDTMADGVKGYYDFINTTRYANLKTAISAKQYAEYLKADGYATSSTYISTLVYTVDTHGLKEYDKQLKGAAVSSGSEQPVNGNPYPEPVTNVRMNSRGEDVKWLQWELNRRGFNLKIDGVAGTRTIGALMVFQSRYGLQPDGVCGAMSRETLKKYK